MHAFTVHAHCIVRHFHRRNTISLIKTANVLDIRNSSACRFFILDFF